MQSQDQRLNLRALKELSHRIWVPVVQMLCKHLKHTSKFRLLLQPPTTYDNLHTLFSTSSSQVNNHINMNKRVLLQAAEVKLTCLLLQLVQPLLHKTPEALYHQLIHLFLCSSSMLTSCMQDNKTT